MTLRSRAPGKAVLLGEYAVTDGLPAISLAVDRSAEVTLTPCDAGDSGLSAPQIWPEAVPFAVTSDGRLAWDRGSGGWPAVAWTAGLIDRLIEALGAARLAPFKLLVDTSELFIEHAGQGEPVERSKLGLGSSSAISVALTQVLTAHLKRHDDLEGDALLQWLLPVYRAAQEGQGSGIDLATAIHGGLIEFSNQEGEIVTKRHAWPEGLLIDFAWTGRAASTPKLLARYRQWQSSRPDQAAQWHALAADWMAEAHAALIAGEAEHLVRLVGAYGRGMSTIGGWMDVDLTADVHRRIMHRAEQLGLAAKPSGAGVGDLAVIAGTSEDAMVDMRRWLASEHITRVEMEAAGRGASIVTR
jgi:phosphomevalonate kinase